MAPKKKSVLVVPWPPEEAVVYKNSARSENQSWSQSKDLVIAEDLRKANIITRDDDSTYVGVSIVEVPPVPKATIAQMIRDNFTEGAAKEALAVWTTAFLDTKPKGPVVTVSYYWKLENCLPAYYRIFTAGTNSITATGEILDPSQTYGDLVTGKTQFTLTFCPADLQFRRYSNVTEWKTPAELKVSFTHDISAATQK